MTDLMFLTLLLNEIYCKSRQNSEPIMAGPNIGDVLQRMARGEMENSDIQSPEFRAELEAALAPDRLCAAFTEDR